MSDKTGIEWTDATWKAFTGCTAVSPGCDRCYAASLASGRLAHVPAYEGLASGGVFNGKVRLLPDRLDQPLRWTRPRRIFVNSMSDAFHEGVPDEYLARVFAVMHDAEQHSFQVLSKRHGRMRSLLNSERFRDLLTGALATLRAADERHRDPGLRWPLPNVWLGVSVEDQHWADIRIPALLQTPAAVRFLSCEPLLGPVDLHLTEEVGGCNCAGGTPEFSYMHERHCGLEPGVAWDRLHWVIAGGESGHGARPMRPAWARSLRDQCQAAGVPFLFKQWGEFAPARNDEAWQVGTEFWPVWRYGKKAAGRVLDGRTWDEYPDTAQAVA